MKNLLKNSFVLLMIIGILFGLSNCSNNKEDTISQQENVEEVIDDSEDITSDTQEFQNENIQSSSSKKWPKMLPSDFPKFEKGNITSSQESNMAGTVRLSLEISDVEAEDVTAYVDKLVDYGFEKQVYGEDEEEIGGVLIKGTDNLTLGWYSEDKLFEMVYSGSEE